MGAESADITTEFYRRRCHASLLTLWAWSGCAATCAWPTMLPSTTRCASAGRCIALFIFDDDILAPLPRADRRVEFIRQSAERSWTMRCARPRAAPTPGLHRAPRPARTSRSRTWPRQLGAQAVFTATGTTSPTPWPATPACARPWPPRAWPCTPFKDHMVLCGRDEVLTQAGAPFSVFTPYKNAWLRPDHAPSSLSAYPRERDLPSSAWPRGPKASAAPCPPRPHLVL